MRPFQDVADFLSPRAELLKLYNVHDTITWGHVKMQGLCALCCFVLAALSFRPVICRGTPPAVGSVWSLASMW